jgi:hypothetical protein
MKSSPSRRSYTSGRPRRKPNGEVTLRLVAWVRSFIPLPRCSVTSIEITIRMTVNAWGPVGGDNQLGR